ncbi:MAG: hypothetical protein II275_02715, partial [Bacteroidaceae bacterium]|nr:hypothetical protein [Bacteroidaceae bacterium]
MRSFFAHPLRHALGCEWYGGLMIVTCPPLWFTNSPIIPIRTCKYTLNEKAIEEGRVKICLEYHIKRCAA